MTIFGLLWLLLVLGVFGYEGFALHSERKGDTLSEQVWGLARRSRGFVAVVTSGLVWLLWHFVVEPRFFPGLHLTTFTDDIIIGVGFSALGFWAGPIENAGRRGR